MDEWRRLGKGDDARAAFLMLQEWAGLFPGMLDEAFLADVPARAGLSSLDAHDSIRAFARRDLVAICDLDLGRNWVVMLPAMHGPFIPAHMALAPLWRMNG